MMRRHWLTLALAAALAAPAALAQEEQEAGDTAEVDRDAQGPLRERIRPVSGHLFLKKGRFELSPSASVSLKDPFFNKYVFGGSLSYHPWETLGFAVRGGYSLVTIGGAVQICTDTCHPPTMAELDGRATGQITLLAGADVLWSPIYGKISLLAESFLHFDLYAIAGAAAVQYRGPNADGTAGSTAAISPGADLGVGMRVFLNRWFTTRVELRDVFYFENTFLKPNAPTHQFLVEVGVSIFFPMSFQEG